MDAVIFGAIIGCLLLYMAWERRETRREQSKLVNALVSKTPEQLRDLEFVDKVEIPKMVTQEADLKPSDQLSDEEFAEMVGQDNG